jgi:hypothetical protein
MEPGHWPPGPRSTLTVADVIDLLSVTFTMSHLHKLIAGEMWHDILQVMQRTGMNALRSMGWDLQSDEL